MILAFEVMTRVSLKVTGYYVIACDRRTDYISTRRGFSLGKATLGALLHPE